MLMVHFTYIKETSPFRHVYLNYQKWYKLDFVSLIFRPYSAQCDRTVRMCNFMGS